MNNAETENVGWVSDSVTQQNQNNRIGENMLGYAALTQPTTLQKDWSVMCNPDLPEGWVIAQIGDVAAKALQRVPADDDEFIYVDIGSINRNLKKISEPQKLLGKDAPSRARKVINTGDILVSLTRPNLNAVALVGHELDNQIASTGFEVIKPIAVDSRYIFSVVRSNPFIEAISGKVQGALYPAAKSEDVRGYEFFLPPLAEQHQIAAKLDELLAQVDSIKTRLDAIAKILKRFRQSVLAAAVSGKLTEDWREDNPCTKYSDNSVEITKFRGKELCKLPNNWQWLKFDQVATVASNLQDPLLTPEAFHVAPNHLESGTGKLLEYTTVSEDNVTSSKHRFYEGQILYSKIRPYLCKAAIVNFSGLCSADMYPIISNINTQYLFRWILSNQFTDWASSAESRSVLPKINQRDLGVIPVPTPPIQEQTEIVRRVDQLFAYADQIEQRVKDAQARVNQLTQSTLAKAFRGELTADWRAQNPDLISGDNSAEALLAKIQAERITTSSKTARRSKSNDK